MSSADRQNLALLILKRLTAALHTCRLYGPAHPRMQDALADLTVLATRYLRRHDALVVEVARTAWRFAFDGTERVNEQVTPLLQALHGRGVLELRLAPGTTEGEIRALLSVLVLPIERVRALGGPAAALSGRDVRHIAVREITAIDGRDRGEETPGIVPPAAGGILKQFVAAARTVRLYGERHPSVNGAVEELFTALAAALAGARSIHYELRAGVVLAGNAPVEGDPVAAAAFASDCTARQIESLTFVRGLTREELAQTVALFAKDPEALVVEGGFPEALRVRHVTHVS